MARVIKTVVETSPQRGEDTLETSHFEISPETSPQRGED